MSAQFPELSDELTEARCLELINSGEVTAYELLIDTLPGAERHFRRVDKAICGLLAEVRRAFPDAAFYTASGGFNLMLGNSHGTREEGQQQLVALSGAARIGDGDF